MSFPSLLGSQQAVASVDATTSRGVTVDPHDTAHTKGSYAEIHSSLPFTARWVEIFNAGTLATAGDCLVDIAVGAATSEQVILANFLAHRQVSSANASVLMPLFIPIGSRVAARAQCSSASETGVKVGFKFYAEMPRSSGGLQQVTTYGANTGDSGGTGIDPGGTANTKGSYTEITSSTTAWARWYVTAVSNQKNGAMTTSHWLFDVAIGAAASEQIVDPDEYFGAASAASTIHPQWATHPLEIPEGVRVAVRAQSATNDATDRLFDIVLYLFS